MCQVELSQAVNDDIEKDIINNVQFKNQINLDNLVKAKN
jgi:hypothetical protein